MSGNYFTTLKLAVAIVMMGGGAAFTAGKLTVGATDAKLAEHLKDGVIHPEAARRLSQMRGEFVAQAQQAQKSAMNAEYDSKYTRQMMEHWLRNEGIEPPPPPPRPEPIAVPDAGVDAGVDAGTIDGGAE